MNFRANDHSLGRRCSLRKSLVARADVAAAATITASWGFTCGRRKKNYPTEQSKCLHDRKENECGVGQRYYIIRYKKYWLNFLGHRADLGAFVEDSVAEISLADDQYRRIFEPFQYPSRTVTFAKANNVHHLIKVICFAPRTYTHWKQKFVIPGVFGKFASTCTWTITCTIKPTPRFPGIFF